MKGAGFRCPQCGGQLEEQETGSDQLRLACTRGHAVSADELFAIFAGVLERGEAFPWATTVQILTEYIDLAGRLARLARQRGDSDAAAELGRRARGRAAPVAAAPGPGGGPPSPAPGPPPP